MQPDLELVHIRKDESFAAWQHGYPFRTVRWHYHPEYEIHLVVSTTGKFYIGDHIGHFAPGQLVMTGPYLPQNWISNIPKDKFERRRSQVIQFPESFIEATLEVVPEMDAFRTLLSRSRRGLLFDNETGKALEPIMSELMDARGIKRIALFCEVVDRLVHAPEPQILASLNFQIEMGSAEDTGVNRAIHYLRENLTSPITEAELAELTGQSASSFSRSFKRHTGMTLVRYKNQLRIDLACHMLLTDPDTRVADICFEVGFANLSNFNRHFLKLKGMSPSEFRSTFAANNVACMTG
ncbi:Helix-turn-helix domain-containing protein [Cohaesibacter sp. ES.047]|uniref:helix-turn-helix domain-containing protein n=1 Tax=Cohaesibacter sp. ES.047 TaxID=1798205 RepID=UPI000BB76D3A|nr:AraC family transcriptional regulator [Cohaesibacter sp. ES.047]SNY92942.1 Helix-turn-helix domain-containing protein [Cohaesibacter sp. ES.047]